jgi:hypothetical protein
LDARGGSSTARYAYRLESIANAIAPSISDDFPAAKQGRRFRREPDSTRLARRKASPQSG